MNVLSLFDGMSCGQIALKEIGIKVDNYFASEIDKFAIQQTQHNFPNTIQLGSVTDIVAKDLPLIDLLIGGSPCQGFSFAGKQLNFDDPRSSLFFEFVRLKNELKPKYFMLENVNMKKEYLRIISEYLGIFPVRINSNLVSAQNRDRWFWTNIKTKKVGLFSELWSDIPQPKDRGILLKDILQPEKEIDKKYYLSDKMLNYFDKRAANFNNGKVNIRNESDKASTITASSKSVDISDNFIKVNTSLNPSKEQKKSGCLTAGGHSGGLHSDMDIICVAQRGKETTCLTPKRTEYGKQIRKDYESGKIKEQRKNIQQLEPRDDGKTNTLTSVQKDNLIMQIKAATSRDVDISFNENGTIRPHKKDYKKSGISEIGTIAVPLSKSSTITASHEPKLFSDYKLRRLTPIEAARLQTIPEWYSWQPSSDTQIYRMLGNGWTIEIIKHILSYMTWK